ncbi:hypothetical protein, partial [Thermococcus sp.]|uniref:hypothetical protein n=1 Tax=Thermococcus sp. TaxID=35749 RepID=UPI002623B180
MRIVFTEGPLDVLLLRSILVKMFRLEDATRSEDASLIRRHFRNLLIRLQADGIIRIVRKSNGETIVIVSVEGKDNFPEIVSATRPLRRIAEETNEDLKGIILVGDRDASEILKELVNPDGDIPILALVYGG